MGKKFKEVGGKVGGKIRSIGEKLGIVKGDESTKPDSKRKQSKGAALAEERGLGDSGKGRHWALHHGKLVNKRNPRRNTNVSGETQYTKFGKEIHTERKNRRKESGEFDLVDSPMKDDAGEEIQVPKAHDLKTGMPKSNKGTKQVQPDAVSFTKGLIVDDKPLERNVLTKDRQQIIGYIRAYDEKTGELPNTIAIERYDSVTGQPVKTDLYKPKDFLP
ncbi:MAG: hypothetical protein GY832_00505 [Chloroflexi bacterium]|nr:hypothetical protein [Chloroflexota bacterium]